MYRLTVERRLEVKRQRIIEGGKRSFEVQRFNAFARQTTRATQDDGAVLDAEAIETEALEQSCKRGSTRSRSTIGTGLRGWFRHPDHRLEQRNLGHLHPSAEERNQSKAKVQLFRRGQIDRVVGASPLRHADILGDQFQHWERRDVQGAVDR